MSNKRHWNYRITKQKIITPIREFYEYALREIHWKGEKVELYTENPIEFIVYAEDNETDEGMRNQLIESLTRALKSITENPIVDIDQLPWRKNVDKSKTE